ncbi:MAG: ABC transporter permease [Tannerellaceae bacterium]|jgi:putative ABC transport system permease protein|nr:ABC transporter permease [Tannerellaceae bacterium]
MNLLKILFRSSFKKNKNNLIKILSLSVGLALGLVLIAKVYFEQSYNDFFPDKERIYQVISNYSSTDGHKAFPQTPGGIVVGMKAELPEIEVATRYTWLAVTALVTPEKQKYFGRVILGDTCLFDVFSRPILTGDPKDVLSRPMYAMISREIAEKMGGIREAVGKTFDLDSRPGRMITVGGVFEDIPRNSHLDYDVVLSMVSIGNYTYDGSLNWLGNDRYLSYVKLYPGVQPHSLQPGLEQMKGKYMPLEEMEKSGFSVGWDFGLLSEIHTGNEETRRMTLIFFILAMAMLFVAVMNYVLIVISSLVGRSREMVVNKCYGASTGNIYSRMFSETFIDLAVSLIFAGLLIFFFRGTILSLLETTLGDLFTVRSVLLLLGVCVFVLFTAALLPGYLYARVPIAVAFRNFTESRRYWKLALLSIQFAAAGFFVVLLVVVGRQYQFMLNDDPGYNYDNLAYASLSGVDVELRQKALDEVRRLPNVADVTSCDQLFFDPASGNNIYLPNDDRELFNVADLYNVDNDYLKIMGISLIEGQSFTEDVSSSREVLVSRSFIDKILPYTNWEDGVVGKSILITEHSHNREPFTIRGVYEDVRLKIIGNHDTRPSIMFYSDKPSSKLLIKFHEETPEAIKQVENLLAEVMPNKDVVVYSYSGEMVNKYQDSRKLRNSVMIAGMATLIICLIGLLGYTNDEMNRRKKETAIRKVNGATIFDIERLFLNDINRIALPAIVLGCCMAYIVSKSWLEKFADKAELTVYLFISCGLVVLFVILTAVVVNCYRAATENPAECVKTD